MCKMWANILSHVMEFEYYNMSVALFFFKKKKMLMCYLTL